VFNFAPIEEAHKPAGRRHNHPLGDVATLGPHGDTPVDTSHVIADELPEFARDLLGEFARGSQDQDPAPRGLLLLPHEIGEGQHIGKSLAAAGRRNSNQMPIGEDNRNGV
jgi:hypothetical protein